MPRLTSACENWVGSPSTHASASRDPLLDRHRLRQRAAEQRRDLVDERADAQDLAAIVAAPAERQQAAGQLRAALGLAQDIGRVGTRHRILDGLGEPVGETHDRREHVVHVVREPRGERADRLEPLRVDELVGELRPRLLRPRELDEPLLGFVRASGPSGAGTRTRTAARRASRAARIRSRSLRARARPA